MIKNLVIVESPAKAKTIERFLGKEFMVKSSMGHVMDLEKKGLGVDIDKGFEPKYTISEDKKKIVTDLKKIAKQAEMIWLATDEDREGEAISWHLYKALGLNDEHTRRIVFHEITKNAIKKAIDNPRNIDKNLVHAQQARRVLDRLVGFELSPLLWKKVKPALSAGRVQSVAVRLIVEREEEIANFKPEAAFRITAQMKVNTKEGEGIFTAELPKRFKTKEEARQFLEKCSSADFTVESIETKPAKKSPAPPFTTSTLQQDASRKLGFSVANTMRVAQQLYEAGLITYMRTDSLSLSNMALTTAKKEIENTYGEKYVKTRQFTTRSKGAQEAHEAIRPTYINNTEIKGTSAQQKLYDLIWKRTIASQMSDAQIERTTVKINISGMDEKLSASGEVIKFDGFLKVYIESTEDENSEKKSGILPPLKEGDKPDMVEMNAEQKFSQAPWRYSEASLVKKLEELGIGRPSTYAPTISTIQNREYIVKGTSEGTNREYLTLKLKNGSVTEKKKTEKTGRDKGKLVPTDIGKLVNKFLIQFFDNIIDYNFTARVEKHFDEIAKGNEVWNDMIEDFYEDFHKQVKETEDTKKFSGERLLGKDPKSGKNVYVKMGRYGPVVQIGETESDEKPRFAGLKAGQSLESINLEEALDLFNYPRTIGSYEGEDIMVSIGRYGPYIKHKKQFFSIGKKEDPAMVDQERAIEIIEQKRKLDKEKVIKTFDEEGMQILRGPYGPYISFKKNNYRIPKSKDPSQLTLDDCRKIIEKAPAKKRGGRKK